MRTCSSYSVLPLLAAVVGFGATARATGQRPSDSITLNARDEDLTNLLQALSAQHRLNLVVGDQVKGKVTITCSTSRSRTR